MALNQVWCLLAKRSTTLSESVSHLTYYALIKPDGALSNGTYLRIDKNRLKDRRFSAFRDTLELEGKYLFESLSKTNWE